MNRYLLLACTAFVVAFCALTSTAHAQATRTWVSGVGDDANPCSRTAPCKTWAGAISKTAAGGEIDALDPGGFGALTITKSIVLDGGGGQVASVLVAGTNGITIAAGATDRVTIRNIRFQGLVGNGTNANAGLNGVSITSGGQVNLEHDVMQYFSQAGISLTGQTSLNVTDCVVEDNVGGGVVITGSAVVPHVTIDSSEILDNSNGSAGTGVGVSANGTTKVVVSNSTISQNQDGVFATAQATIFVYDSQVVNNFGNGLHTTNGGGIDAAGSTIADNQGVGVLPSGGGIGTFGTNILLRNAGGNGTWSGSDGAPQIRVHPGFIRPPAR